MINSRYDLPNQLNLLFSIYFTIVIEQKLHWGTKYLSFFIRLDYKRVIIPLESIINILIIICHSPFLSWCLFYLASLWLFLILIRISHSLTFGWHSFFLPSFLSSSIWLLLHFMSSKHFSLFISLFDWFLLFLDCILRNCREKC